MLTHLVLPSLLLVFGTWALMFGGGDMWLAQTAYALQGGKWALRNDLFTETLVHRGGRVLAALVWLFLLGWLLVSWLTNSGRRWRPTLVYLVVSVVCSVALVTALKRGLVVDCAWSVAGLGGERSHLTLLDPRPAAYAADHCFPAAHASVGYAWLALYFAGFGSRRGRWLGLAIGLGAGLLFGICQQLRGAHFASHDVWAAIICWWVALAWRPLLQGVQR
jgi:membrane-associated PAP2 superfamily phosphatase